MPLTQQTYAIPLSAQLRLGWVTGLELFKQAVLTASFVGLVIAGAALLPFFAASVVAGFAVLVLTLAVIRSEHVLRPSADSTVWRRILRDVLPYAVATAVGLLYFRLAVILMSYVATDFETGIYSTSFRIVEVVAVIPWLVVSSAFPILARAARDDEDRLRYALQRLFEASTIVGAAIALMLALGAEFAVEVIGGLPEFEESVPVLRMLALALVTAFLVATWSFALLSLRALYGGVAHLQRDRGRHSRAGHSPACSRRRRDGRRVSHPGRRGRSGAQLPHCPAPSASGADTANRRRTEGRGGSCRGTPVPRYWGCTPRRRRPSAALRSPPSCSCWARFPTSSSPRCAGAIRSRSRPRASGRTA